MRSWGWVGGSHGRSGEVAAAYGWRGDAWAVRSEESCELVGGAAQKHKGRACGGAPICMALLRFGSTRLFL